MEDPESFFQNFLAERDAKKGAGPQFVEGLKSGVSLGYLGEEEPEDLTTGAKVSRIGGELLGFLPPGLAASFLASTGLGAVGAAPALAKGASLGSKLFRAAKVEGLAGAGLGAATKPGTLGTGEDRAENAAVYGGLGVASPYVAGAIGGAAKKIGGGIAKRFRGTRDIPEADTFFKDLLDEADSVKIETPVVPETISEAVPEKKFAPPVEAEILSSGPGETPLALSKHFDDEAQVIPEVSLNPRMMEFFPPKTVEEKIVQLAKKVPHVEDPEFEQLSLPLKKFVQEYVHSPLPEISDDIALGATYSEALSEAADKMVEKEFADLTPARLLQDDVSPLTPNKVRTKKLREFKAALVSGNDELAEQMSDIFNPATTDMPELINASNRRARLAVGTLEGVLGKLDPDFPIADLGEKLGIPDHQAEEIFFDLRNRIKISREAFERSGSETDPITQEITAPFKAAVQRSSGAVRMSPEELNFALRHTEITPQQFIGKGLLTSEGEVSSEGEALLNFVNREWKFPVGEKVYQGPPGTGGFDVNSPQGREALASVRSGGKSKVALPYETLQGLLPGRPELSKAVNRAKPLVRKVEGGFQYTEAGAAAANNSKILKELNLEANLRYMQVPEGEYVGGRGGKSFAGLSEADVARALAEYEARKAVLIEMKQSVLQWKGCPPGTHEA